MTNFMQSVADGFTNLVANLGTSRDKSAGNTWANTSLTDDRLIASYRTSSTAKKIINLPAEDATREWREWQASGPQISKIEEVEASLGLQKKVQTALKRARLWGGAAILIGTGDADPSQPLDPEGVKKGGLKYLTVLSRRHLIAGQMQNDPRLPGYGEPAFYTLNTGHGVGLTIHPTRLAIFHGADAPDQDTATENIGWGDSVLTAVLEKVGHLDATVANIASLVFEAKVDVVKIKDFTQNLREGGAKYEELMTRRWQLAATAKGINGVLMMDANEEYEQKTANFSTLPDIVDRFMQVVSSAASIPMTLLFGMSPGGMNATGESDVRGYYDRVKVLQSLEVGPAMAILDECLIRSALGSRPTGLHYNWTPLWQPTSKEKADVANVLTQAVERLYKMDVLPEEAIGNAIVNALTESGAFPGLEAEADKYFGDEEGYAVSDAAPRSLYVRRNVLNAKEIIAWAKEQGFKSTLPEDDLHVTLAFSRTPVDWMKTGDDWQETVEVNAGGARIMEAFGDAIVLLFSSSHLSWRHEEIKERAGATWDHPEYQPHITISYDPDSPDLKDITPYTGKILLGPEIFEEVNESWREGIVE